MNTLKRIFGNVNRVFVTAGCISLVAISILTAAGIAGRIQGTPLQGTYELTGLLCACAAGFGFELTRSRKENITVDILFSRFHGRVRTYMLVINDILCALIFGFTCCFLIKYVITLIQVSELTETLRIPCYPFVICLAAGTGFVSLNYIFEVIRALKGEEENIES